MDGSPANKGKQYRLLNIDHALFRRRSVELKIVPQLAKSAIIWMLKPGNPKQRASLIGPFVKAKGLH